MSPKHAMAPCACITLGLGLMSGCTDRQVTPVEEEMPTALAPSSNSLSPDQSNDVILGVPFGCGSPATGNLGQSFTPSAPTIPALELRLLAGSAFPSGGVATTVRVRRSSMSGPVIATAAGFVASPGQTLTRFEFKPSAKVRAGDTHVIEWVSPAQGEAVLAWIGNASDTYGGGSFIGCTGAPVGDRDLAFTTYRTGQGPSAKPDRAPLAVTVVPTSLTLAPGEMGLLVATVTGGSDDDARTVIWSSSNDGVASVGASGIITANGPGDATITATATADAAVGATARVTVIGGPTDTPVTIGITSVTGVSGSPVDPQNTAGLIQVTLNVQGSPPAVIDRVETLLDETVVCVQGFTTAAADVTTADATQASLDIVCTINTAAFSGSSGETTWKNGAHQLSARAVRPDGESVATPPTQLVFNNTSFINVGWSGSLPSAASAPAPRSLDTAGAVWLSGDIYIDLLPVVYGTAADVVASATVTLMTSGDGVTGVAGCTTTNDAQMNPTIAQVDRGTGDALVPGCPSQTIWKAANASSPISIVFSMSDRMTSPTPGLRDVEDVLAIEVTSVTAGGQPGPTCINPHPVFNPQNGGCVPYFPEPLRVDNLAPRVTQLSIERQPNQYFGPNVFLLDHQPGPVPAIAGTCTAPCARTVDYGVGGSSATFLAGPLDDEVVVTNGGPELSETETSEDYVFAATVTDRAGNVETRWATDPFVTGNDLSLTTDDPRDDDNLLQFFGWDVTPPYIELVRAPADMEVNPFDTTVDIIPIDESQPPGGPAGFLADPFNVRARRLLRGSTSCRNVEAGYAQVFCGGTLAGFRPSDGTFDLPEAAGQEGYFEFTLGLDDAAGNKAPEIGFWILQDVTAPDVGGINSPSTILGGQTVTFEASAKDNVELGSVSPYIGFGGMYINFPMPDAALGIKPLAEFGFASTDASMLVSATIDGMIRSLDDASATAGVPPAQPVSADEVAFHVRDMAGYRLRYVNTPWKVGAAGFDDDGGACPGQNCTVSNEAIATRIEDPTEPAFTFLVDLNADARNPGMLDVPGGALGFDWGAFRMLGYAAGNDVVCSDGGGACPSGASATIDLEAVVQGPLDAFTQPFAAVWFLYQNGEGNWDFIGTASVSVREDPTDETRTFRYLGTWNAAVPRVRPAGDPGTGYTVVALGITADGDALISAPVTITVEGDPQ